jgi:hypothetical protein
MFFLFAETDIIPSLKWCYLVARFHTKTRMPTFIGAADKCACTLPKYSDEVWIDVANVQRATFHEAWREMHHQLTSHWYDHHLVTYFPGKRWNVKQCYDHIGVIQSPQQFLTSVRSTLLFFLSKQKKIEKRNFVLLL